jgi:hypothetical protein
VLGYIKAPRLIVSNNLNSFVAGPKTEMKRNERKRFARFFYVGGTISLTLRFFMSMLLPLSHLNVAVGPPHVMI